MRPTCLLALIIAPLLLSIGGQATAATKTIKCSSDKHRLKTCAVDDTINAQLTKKLSKSPCLRGKTWGFDKDGVWVRYGCRGEFQVEYKAPPPPRANAGKFVRTDVFCASPRGKYLHCKADTRGKIRLLHQVSRKDCQFGKSWGKDEHGIWVDRGCSGLFRIVRRTDPPTRREHFQCASKDFLFVHCEVQVPATINFGKQISNTRCIRDKNWGFDSKGVWVKDGCSAQFKVDIQVNEPPAWLIGRFIGHTKRSGKEVRLHIRRNGTVKARIDGERVQAEWEDDVLVVNGRSFVLSKRRDGFKAERTAAGRYHAIRFRRIN